MRAGLVYHAHMLGSRPFQPWSADHIAALAATTVLAVLLPPLVRRLNAAGARRVCAVLATLMLVAVAYEHLSAAIGGTWTLKDTAPLHLCDVSVLATAVALLIAAGAPQTRPLLLQRLYEMSYYWGLGGATQALLTPDISVPTPGLDCGRYFITHGGIVVGAAVMTFGLRLRPRPRSWRWIVAATLLLAGGVGLFNWAVGANYMYLCGPPAQPSLIDYMGPWPWSLGPLIGVAIAIILLCYFPWWVVDRRAARRATPER